MEVRYDAIELLNAGHTPEPFGRPDADVIEAYNASGAARSLSDSLRRLGAPPWLLIISAC
jgi:hypothetical protein